MNVMVSRHSCLGILVAPLILLLVSCSVGSNVFPETGVEGLSPTMSTSSPGGNVSLTPTPLTTALLNTGDIQHTCIDIQEDKPTFPETKGTLVFLDQKDESSRNLRFLNLHSGEEKVLPAEDTETFSVSPKGLYLAYESWTDKRSRVLKISDSNGNLLVTVDEPEDWYGFTWLDDEKLLINYPVGRNPLILLSPFDHQEKILEAYVREKSYVFSDTELIYYWGFYAYHRNVYDPHLTRMLYPSHDDENTGDPIVVIRDLVSNQDLAAFPTNVGWGVSPKWSPDGEKIAIGLNTNTSAGTDGKNEYELFVISRDGEIILSTNLTSLSKRSYTSYLSWSPDGRYVAFRYTTSTDINEDLELAVLDTITRQIANYCVTSNLMDLSFASGEPSPVWSPDSEFLLIQTVEPETNVRNVLIVDIRNGQANMIKSGLVPIGWMK